MNQVSAHIHLPPVFGDEMPFQTITKWVLFSSAGSRVPVYRLGALVNLERKTVLLIYISCKPLYIVSNIFGAQEQ